MTIRSYYSWHLLIYCKLITVRHILKNNTNTETFVNNAASDHTEELENILSDYVSDHVKKILGLI